MCRGRSPGTRCAECSTQSTGGPPWGDGITPSFFCLVTYGLRAHEVAKLTLDDIDWKRERLQIPERKAGHWTAYPLANVVAEALIEYLRSGRPKTQDRHVFFRVLAPQSPITNGAVSTTVAAYLRKAGVHVRRPGAHTLRHTCVQKLIEAESP